MCVALCSFGAVGILVSSGASRVSDGGGTKEGGKISANFRGSSSTPFTNPGLVAGVDVISPIGFALGFSSLRSGADVDFFRRP